MTTTNRPAPATTNLADMAIRLFRWIDSGHDGEQYDDLCYCCRMRATAEYYGHPDDHCWDSYMQQMGIGNGEDVYRTVLHVLVMRGWSVESETAACDGPCVATSR